MPACWKRARPTRSGAQPGTAHASMSPPRPPGSARGGRARPSRGRRDSRRACRVACRQFADLAAPGGPYPELLHDAGCKHSELLVTGLAAALAATHDQSTIEALLDLCALAAGATDFLPELLADRWVLPACPGLGRSAAAARPDLQARLPRARCPAAACAAWQRTHPAPARAAQLATHARTRTRAAGAPTYSPSLACGSMISSAFPAPAPVACCTCCASSAPATPGRVRS